MSILDLMVERVEKQKRILIFLNMSTVKMTLFLAVGMVSAFGVTIMWLSSKEEAVEDLARLKEKKHAKKKTLVDVYGDQDAIQLVRCMSKQGMGTDALADQMHRLLVTFLPDEQQMQCLSLEQQRLQGTGTEAEFCITIVFSLALSVVGAHGYRTIKRSLSVAPQ